MPLAITKLSLHLHTHKTCKILLCTSSPILSIVDFLNESDGERATSNQMTCLLETSLFTTIKDGSTLINEEPKSYPVA
jgi:hypothetical protein